LPSRTALPSGAEKDHLRRRHPARHPQRNARVQILHENIDGMRNLKAARAFEHVAHPGGSTGLLVKDYRGKNGEKEFLRFDAVLVAHMNDTLKQAAIEEGQWTEKRETTGTNINVMMDEINSGRKRVPFRRPPRLTRSLREVHGPIIASTMSTRAGPASCPTRTTSRAFAGAKGISRQLSRRSGGRAGGIDHQVEFVGAVESHPKPSTVGVMQ
jgi:hypothetical protein